MATYETLESLRISATEHGVILPRVSDVSETQKESIKNEIQPQTDDRRNQSFLNHSNGINSRLDSFDNEKTEIIGRLSRLIARNKQPNIADIFRVVELEIMTETALSQYDSKKWKENKIFSQARENFSRYVEKMTRNLPYFLRDSIGNNSNTY